MRWTDELKLIEPPEDGFVPFDILMAGREATIKNLRHHILLNRFRARIEFFTRYTLPGSVSVNGSHQPVNELANDWTLFFRNRRLFPECRQKCFDASANIGRRTQLDKKLFLE